MFRIIKLFTPFFISTGLLFFAGFVFASTTDGTVSGYAWADQIGWVNFGTTNGNIHVTDSAMTGYAWNENKGRILLNPTKSGVANNSEGTLSGRAWCEGTGWINFSGVTINSSGVFSGTATGDNSVNIYFSCTKCNVTTDWRPASSRITPTPAPAPSPGGGGGAVYGPPKPPFSILINGGAAYTNNPVVKLTLDGGPDADDMMISNSGDFSDAVLEDYRQSKPWTLSPGDGLKTVYVKFYTRYGMVSELTTLSRIILDTTPPELAITSIKDKYSSDEDVILSGKTESNTQVILLIDDQYGQFQSDDKGEWTITLGKLPIGNHHIEFFAIDPAGNQGKTVAANFSVERAGITLAPPLEPILRQLEKLITPLIPKFFKPEEKKPVAVLKVPKIPPIAMKSKWSLLPVEAIRRFVLAPLPSDIALLAKKFPQLGKTFSQVGVAKITDVQKLKTTNLNLPGLTQVLGLYPAQIVAGKIAPPKGIPISKLSLIAKQRMPSEIIFAKAGGGLIDLNVALSINAKGKTQQSIEVASRDMFQLVVKTDTQAKKVRGYIVYKSKTPGESSFKVPSNSFVASSFFSNPDFVQPAAVAKSIPIEGAKIPENGSSLVGTSDATEQELVLGVFDYVDTGSGVYTADMEAPIVDGEYEIITVLDYGQSQELAVSSKEIRLVTVVDPEGYIYEKNGDLETRIAGAVASLYWLNPDTKQYELWPARDYQQDNPQITDRRGTYSFLVPDGYYYLKVDAPGYLGYDGKPFEVKEGSGIHINIEMKTRYWWFRIIDWKVILLLIVIFLLLYNFYKDRTREKPAPKNSSQSNP